MSSPEPTSPGTPMNDKWVPYRHPQPKDSPPELVIPNAIPTDERIWVPVEENVWFRPLLLAASRGYWMNLLRVRKSGVLSRHRHPQPVHERQVLLVDHHRDRERDRLRVGRAEPHHDRADVQEQRDVVSVDDREHGSGPNPSPRSSITLYGRTFTNAFA